MTPKDTSLRSRLDKIYPVIFVTNLPANDFLAAADETLRMGDRQVMQHRLLAFIESEIEGNRQKIVKPIIELFKDLRDYTSSTAQKKTLQSQIDALEASLLSKDNHQ